MKLNLYIVVSDMDRAVDFYRAVFQRNAVLHTPTYTAFDLDGALYGLFAASAYPVAVQAGSHCIPNILVTNIEAEHARIQQLHPAYVSEVRANGPYQLFVFVDPDGTVLEFYAPAA